jgi:hypothetical protein
MFAAWILLAAALLLIGRVATYPYAPKHVAAATAADAPTRR